MRASGVHRTSGGERECPSAGFAGGREERSPLPYPRGGKTSIWFAYRRTSTDDLPLWPFYIDAVALEIADDLRLQVVERVAQRGFL